MIAEVASGTFEGERLKGTVLTPGADWVVINEGFGEVDVRLNLLCDDGARIYMYYTGVLEQNEAALEALSGGIGCSSAGPADAGPEGDDFG